MVYKGKACQNHAHHALAVQSSFSVNQRLLEEPINKKLTCPNFSSLMTWLKLYQICLHPFFTCAFFINICLEFLRNFLCMPGKTSFPIEDPLYLKTQIWEVE